MFYANRYKQTIILELASKMLFLFHMTLVLFFCHNQLIVQLTGKEQGFSWQFQIKVFP
jgi:hypothetical protein